MQTDNRELGVGGVYREIDPPGRLVATEAFDEPYYTGEAVSTILLVEHGGRTMLTNTVRSPSREARDGMLQSGMESGVGASYDRLDAYLASGV